MKATIALNKDTKIEVELPVFRKDSAQVFKVYSEKRCLAAHHAGCIDAGIETQQASCAWHPNSIAATEEEFKEAFVIALCKLQQIATDF